MKVCICDKLHSCIFGSQLFIHNPPTLEDGRSHGQQRKCWMDNIKSGHPCLCQNCSESANGSLQQKRLVPLLNCLSYTINNPISQGTEMNYTLTLSSFSYFWKKVMTVIIEINCFLDPFNYFDPLCAVF